MNIFRFFSYLMLSIYLSLSNIKKVYYFIIFSEFGLQRLHSIQQRAWNGVQLIGCADLEDPLDPR